MERFGPSRQTSPRTVRSDDSGGSSSVHASAVSTSSASGRTGGVRGPAAGARPRPPCDRREDLPERIVLVDVLEDVAPVHKHVPRHEVGPTEARRIEPLPWIRRVRARNGAHDAVRARDRATGERRRSGPGRCDRSGSGAVPRSRTGARTSRSDSSRSSAIAATGSERPGIGTIARAGVTVPDGIHRPVGPASVRGLRREQRIRVRGSAGRAGPARARAPGHRSSGRCPAAACRRARTGPRRRRRRDPARAAGRRCPDGRPAIGHGARWRCRPGQTQGSGVDSPLPEVVLLAERFEPGVRGRGATGSEHRLQEVPLPEEQDDLGVGPAGVRADAGDVGNGQVLGRRRPPRVPRNRRHRPGRRGSTPPTPRWRRTGPPRRRPGAGPGPAWRPSDRASSTSRRTEASTSAGAATTDTRGASEPTSPTRERGRSGPAGAPPRAIRAASGDRCGP